MFNKVDLSLLLFPSPREAVTTASISYPLTASISQAEQKSTMQVLDLPSPRILSTSLGCTQVKKKRKEQNQLEAPSQIHKESESDLD